MTWTSLLPADPFTGILSDVSTAAAGIVGILIVVLGIGILVRVLGR